MAFIKISDNEILSFRFRNMADFLRDTRLSTTINPSG